MALSEHIKKLALDAVGNNETIQWIRKHSDANSGALFNNIEREQGMTPRLMAETDNIMTTASVLKGIRLEAVSNISRPMVTPSRQSRRMTQAVLGMYASGHSMGDIHQAITSDTFGVGE